MPKQPNVVFLLVDQLAAQVLSTYGADMIDTPNIARMAAAGVTFDNMISTCPVCTPYRSMWLTGRHPQSTGHVVNFLETRYDEIGWGDVYAHAGYDTGYVGKWHLGRGSFPQIPGPDFVPEGRPRLGFSWWRGYNFHVDYFDGTVNLDDWRFERWSGYETQALNRYAFEFFDKVREQEKPFCLMISPHQPHSTTGKSVPEEYYERLPDPLPLPPSWDNQDRPTETNLANLRNYLAMILAVDDMLGELMDTLENRGLTDSTILVLSSDHGTNLNAHDNGFWGKKMPWEENVRVPLIVRYPGVLDGGKRCDVLTAPVDLLPTFCGLCGIPVPGSVEGHDLSRAWLGEKDAFEQDGVLMMTFCKGYDICEDGWEWRGVRTKTHTYVRYLDGRELLFDNIRDPRQRRNLIRNPEAAAVAGRLRIRLAELLHDRADEMVPGSAYNQWFDPLRRVVANARGPLPHPETEPDWTQLR